MYKMCGNSQTLIVTSYNDIWQLFCGKLLRFDADKSGNRPGCLLTTHVNKYDFCLDSHNAEVYIYDISYMRL